MAEEIKAEETVIQNATEEKNEEVDYAKELEEAAIHTRNDLNAQKRIAKKEEDQTDDSDDIAQKVISQVLPALKATAESSALEVMLEKKASGNESLKKLMRSHYENRTNPGLDMATRVEDAFAIANKKLVDKSIKEINIARQNRSQISNVGQGANTEQVLKPSSNVLSDAQLSELKLKAKRWNLPEKEFIEGALRRMQER